MHAIVLLGIGVSALAALFFSTLTYSLRDFSRAKLSDYLSRRGKERFLDPTVEHTNDLVFVTAVMRLAANLCVLVLVLILFDMLQIAQSVARYVLAVLVTHVVMLFMSVAIPHALARHASSLVIAMNVRLLHVLRWLMSPVTRIMHVIDRLVGTAAGANGKTEPEHIEQEILSVVEEGEKEGVVDEAEREMIESVIEFRNTRVDQIMTARPDIVALPLTASLPRIKQVVEESGHSRIPVYDGTIDQIVGVLYARDLLKHLCTPAERFDIRSVMRPPFEVPESKPLRDLLNDFRARKVHMAIVLDEYGGTAGLVTIEDVLEELVGDISDEHEPQEPAMLKRINPHVSEADARIYVEELNQALDLNLPEDAGYETLGGFVSMTLGRIPEQGTVFEHAGVRYTILDAEPQKVNRVRIEVMEKAASM